jgi:hypothetical protein
MYQIRKTFRSSSSQKQYSETKALGKTDISPFYSKQNIHCTAHLQGNECGLQTPSALPPVLQYGNGSFSVFIAKILVADIQIFFRTILFSNFSTVS